VLQHPAVLQVVLPQAAIKRLVVARALPKTPPEPTEIGPESYQALNSDLRTRDVTRTLRLVLVNNRGPAGQVGVHYTFPCKYTIRRKILSYLHESDSEGVDRNNCNCNFRIDNHDPSRR
jgi:hypothetical protein